MEERLKILHITDIHCAYDKVAQLKGWLKAEQENVDVVLISGDIANVPLDMCHTASKELLQEHHDNLLHIALDFLSVTEKVYFIPGNHDTLSHFETSPSLPESIDYPLNVHTRRVQIAPSLFLLGVGGSVPAFMEGKQLWEGFPYTSDKQFGEVLGSVLDPVVEQEDIPPGDSYIIMTHDGPNKSSTAEVHSATDPVIIAGSDILYDYLIKKKLQDHTVLNVHGHVHPSIGMSSIGSIAVVNPGALVEGNFGIYTLRRVTKCQPSWKVGCVSMHRLSEL